MKKLRPTKISCKQSQTSIWIALCKILIKTLSSHFVPSSSWAIVRVGDHSKTGAFGFLPLSFLIWSLPAACGLHVAKRGQVTEEDRRVFSWLCSFMFCGPSGWAWWIIKADFLLECFCGLYEQAMSILLSPVSFELGRCIPILHGRTCDYFLSSQVSSCSSRLLCWIGHKKTPHSPVWPMWSKDIFPILSIWPHAYLWSDRKSQIIRIVFFFLD